MSPREGAHPDSESLQVLLFDDFTPTKREEKKKVKKKKKAILDGRESA